MPSEAEQNIDRLYRKIDTRDQKIGAQRSEIAHLKKQIAKLEAKQMTSELICDGCGEEILPTTKYIEYHNGLLFHNEECEDQYKPKPL